MAKKAMIVKNEKRIKMVARYVEKRAVLRKARNMKVSEGMTEEEIKELNRKKRDAQIKLNDMPRDSSVIRIRNRCMVTGRPRGYYRKFGMSRIALREFALDGKLPGVKKASW